MGHVWFNSDECNISELRGVVQRLQSTVKCISTKEFKCYKPANKIHIIRKTLDLNINLLELYMLRREGICKTTCPHRHECGNLIQVAYLTLDLLRDNFNKTFDINED